MSNYFGDESPWGAGVQDSMDLTSPWSAEPFTDQSEIAIEPEVEASDPEQSVESSPEAPEEETPDAAATSGNTEPLNTVPTTVFKPVKSNANSKKRRQPLAFESVDSSPLGVNTVQSQLQEVNLNPSTETKFKSGIHHSDSILGADSSSDLLQNSSSQTTQTEAGVDSYIDTSDQSESNKGYKFDIDVADPQRVGELASTHTEFTVKTKTTDPSYENQDSCVQRRFREFAWLYDELVKSHPGDIVPPPPSKQALGRFSKGLISLRRLLLEQMLRKIGANSRLQSDPDFNAFLTSSDFQEYMRTKSTRKPVLDQTAGSSTNTAADAASTAVSSSAPSADSSSSSLGFIGTLSGALQLSRGGSVDPWTVQRNQQLETVYQQLQKTQKLLELVGIEREQLSQAEQGLANALRALAQVGPTQRLTSVLKQFSAVHVRISEVQLRLRDQELLTLEAAVAEHSQLIGSMKLAVDARQRVFTQAEAAASELERRQERLRKATQPDRQAIAEQLVSEQAETAHSLHRRAAEIAQRVERELQRVNSEQQTDLRAALETYLESAIEAQKELIESWESFYGKCFTE